MHKATVAILVVSADFLASDFIVNNELPPLLRNAEEKGTKIIPLIVKLCRFTRDHNLRHFQSVNDPKEALILLSEGEREKYYDLVSSEIEEVLGVAPAVDVELGDHAARREPIALAGALVVSIAGDVGRPGHPPRRSSRGRCIRGPGGW